MMHGLAKFKFRNTNFISKQISCHSYNGRGRVADKLCRPFYHKILYIYIYIYIANDGNS